MQPMRLRLIAMGCIFSVLGAFLLLSRGYSVELLGLILVGIVLLVVGLLWRAPKGEDRSAKGPSR